MSILAQQFSWKNKATVARTQALVHVMLESHVAVPQGGLRGSSQPKLRLNINSMQP